MTPIGGYFELELPQRTEYHSLAIALNTGRNCLEYILRVRSYRHIYLPYFSCEVLLEPFRKLGVEYTFYHVNERLELVEEIELDVDEAILYINYFGLKQSYVDALAQRYGKKLIVDNTRAFFSRPLEGIDTFYSCRKFFGVADGAYLYCDKVLDMRLEKDHSWQRMSHLLKRIDESPEAAYGDFKMCEDQLNDNPVREMSSLTRRIMRSIDFNQVVMIRRYNFKHLDDALGIQNRISMQLDSDSVPMVYPFLSDDETLRQRLIDNKIFVAQYWPNVLALCEKDCTDYRLTKKLVPLPVDQRYGSEEMKLLLSLVK